MGTRVGTQYWEEKKQLILDSNKLKYENELYRIKNDTSAIINKEPFEYVGLVPEATTLLNCSLSYKSFSSIIARLILTNKKMIIE